MSQGAKGCASAGAAVIREGKEGVDGSDAGSTTGDLAEGVNGGPSGTAGKGSASLYPFRRAKSGSRADHCFCFTHAVSGAGAHI